MSADHELRRVDNPYNLKDTLTLVVKNHFFGPSRKHKEAVKNLPEVQTLNQVDTKYSLVFTGDFLNICKGAIQFDEAFTTVVAASDYLVVNLEGMICNAPKVGLFAQRNVLSTFEQLVGLKPKDKVIISVANNHAADFGREAFHQCVAGLVGQGYQVIGTQAKPGIVLNDDLSLTATTEWSNQRSDYLPAIKDVVPPMAKFNILYPHWGNELESFPRPTQVDRAKELIRTWDMIVGHHPHVPQPVTAYPVGQHQRLVAYSLGDFATNYSDPKLLYVLVVRAEIGQTA